MRKPNINGTQLVVSRLGPVSRKTKNAGSIFGAAESGVASDPPNVGGTVASATLRHTPATKFLPFVVAPGQGLCVHPMPHPDTHRAGARATPHPASAPTYLPQCHLCPTPQAPCLPARTRDQFGAAGRRTSRVNAGGWRGCSPSTAATATHGCPSVARSATSTRSSRRRGTDPGQTGSGAALGRRPGQPARPQHSGGTPAENVADARRNGDADDLRHGCRRGNARHPVPNLFHDGAWPRNRGVHVYFSIPWIFDRERWKVVFPQPHHDTPGSE